MNSQNYEIGDGDDGTDGILDDADARFARLRERLTAINERRRALIEPQYKTVVANPTDLHTKIVLGAVMLNIGLTAKDADALAGLLMRQADKAFADCTLAVEADPLASFGTAITRVIDLHSRDLTAQGLFETWSRRFATYAEDCAEWMARDEEYRLEGAWRYEAMTQDQRWLIRVTCRILEINLPGEVRRGYAADWLEAKGANLNYWDFFR